MESGLNWIPIIVGALVPMFIGAIYYGPLFGKPWMESLGFTEEDLKKANMAVIYGLALFLSFLLSMFTDIFLEITHKDISDSGELIFASHHTFGHGTFHGFFLGIFVAIPVLVTNSLFERRSAKNILINVGYWLLTISLLGGLLDAWN